MTCHPRVVGVRGRPIAQQVAQRVIRPAHPLIGQVVGGDDRCAAVDLHRRAVAHGVVARGGGAAGGFHRADQPQQPVVGGVGDPLGRVEPGHEGVGRTAAIAALGWGDQRDVGRVGLAGHGGAAARVERDTPATVKLAAAQGGGVDRRRAGRGERGDKGIRHAAGAGLLGGDGREIGGEGGAGDKCRSNGPLGPTWAAKLLLQKDTGNNQLSDSDRRSPCLRQHSANCLIRSEAREGIWHTQFQHRLAAGNYNHLLVDLIKQTFKVYEAHVAVIDRRGKH